MEWHCPDDGRALIGSGVALCSRVVCLARIMSVFSVAVWAVSQCSQCRVVAGLGAGRCRAGCWGACWLGGWTAAGLWRVRRCGCGAAALSEHFRWLCVRVLVGLRVWLAGVTLMESLILAQDERWRRA